MGAPRCKASGHGISCKGDISGYAPKCDLEFPLAIDTKQKSLSLSTILILLNLMMFDLCFARRLTMRYRGMNLCDRYVCNHVYICTCVYTRWKVQPSKTMCARKNRLTPAHMCNVQHDVKNKHTPILPSEPITWKKKGYLKWPRKRRSCDQNPCFPHVSFLGINGYINHSPVLHLTIHPNHLFSPRSHLAVVFSTLAAWESRDLSSCWGQLWLPKVVAYITYYDHMKMSI